MQIERAYVGTWFPRTFLHLKELFLFFHHRRGVSGLDQKRIKEYWKSLAPRNVELHEERDFDHLVVQCGQIDLSITEDGILLLRSESARPKQTLEQLESFYVTRLGPAITYLFSRGAPLPKELANIQEVYPIPLVVKQLSSDEIEDIFREFNDSVVSTAFSPSIHVLSGEKVIVLNVQGGSLFADDIRMEDLIRYIVFFREFEGQLAGYLELHRMLWDRVSQIRESGTVRYKDFPAIREEMLEFLKSISFVKARLGQMDDIMRERETMTQPEFREELTRIGLYRFDALKAERGYIQNLWSMTEDYSKGTLSLLDSLFSENTQRELQALKLVTVIAAVTSFFGMNIGFPWEDRWPEVVNSSLFVVGLIFFIVIGFHWVLQRVIYNRYFTIHSDSYAPNGQQKKRTRI